MTTETRRTLPQPDDPNREPVIKLPIRVPRLALATGLQYQSLRPRIAWTPGIPEYPAGSRIQKTPGQTVIPGGNGRQVAAHPTGQRHQGPPSWTGRRKIIPTLPRPAGTSSTTGTDEEACRPYFAQLDAVLTHIYLNEAAAQEVRDEIQRVNDEYNDGIYRIAHKMATATGKTPVMAMLILYHTAKPPERRPPTITGSLAVFSSSPPGLTVRERLQDSLDPGHDDSDWKAFNLLPPGDQWEHALASASVNVINYHQMQPRDAGADQHKAAAAH